MRWPSCKDSACNARDTGSIPCSGRCPGVCRKGQPAPAFLSEESCAQRSLAVYSPGGHKEPDVTEHEHQIADLQCCGRLC